MADIVNLNKFRKQKQRADHSRRADENRRKYGRTKAERVKEESDRMHVDKQLDGHKLDKPEPPTEN